MKRTFLNLSALVLALVMLLTVLSGCQNPGITDNNEESTESTENTDSTTITQSAQIKTTL